MKVSHIMFVKFMLNEPLPEIGPPELVQLLCCSSSRTRKTQLVKLRSQDESIQIYGLTCKPDRRQLPLFTVVDFLRLLRLLCNIPGALNLRIIYILNVQPHGVTSQ